MHKRFGLRSDSLRAGIFGRARSNSDSAIFIVFLCTREDTNLPSSSTEIITLDCEGVPKGTVPEPDSTSPAKDTVIEPSGIQGCDPRVRNNTGGPLIWLQEAGQMSAISWATRVHVGAPSSCSNVEPSTSSGRLEMCALIHLDSRWLRMDAAPFCYGNSRLLGMHIRVFRGIWSTMESHVQR